MKRIGLSELDEMSSRYRAAFVNSLSGFKSVYLIGTKSTQQITNLAPFNSIMHIGSKPAMLGYIARPETEEHQTLKNIRETGFYTINNVLPSFYQKAHQCSAKYNATQSEFTEVGLEEVYSNDFPAPYVKGSTLQIGLELQEIIPIKLNDTSMVIGKVVEINLDESLIEADGFVNLEAAESLATLGLNRYYKTQHIGYLPYANN
jgi:flavin reductase (DIM6/NTAB) family NADH-FMN oxidoreductase RutF